jgi:magnesium chelatase family protein
MGFATVWGFALAGIEAVPVRVEAHARNGLPGVTIVGLPGAAVREARERVRSGAASIGFALPSKRITINLSPGDVPKDGPGFDLPVALATLAACGYLPAEAARRVGAVGEVSLDGLVRATRGLVSVAEAADRVGVDLLVVPIAGLAVASEISRGPVVGVRSLGEALAVVRDCRARDRLLERGRRWVRLNRTSGEEGAGSPDLAEVVGHRHAKRVLEIVAAGGHHLLMVGPPGAGKTMLARRLPTLLPPLDREESIEVTRVWSAAGLRAAQDGLIKERPFRAPHHSASRAALVGGGMVLRPGEVSLAHRGVLFLDELPEFSRDCLEALCEPVEEGQVVISRRSGALTFPAACTVIAAMNPCPCGYLGHPQRACQCTSAAVQGYRAKVSGPLLDRIDAVIDVPPVTTFEPDLADPSESSAAVRERVMAAVRFRAERDRRLPGVLPALSSPPSDSWTGGGAAVVGWLSKEARTLLQQALTRGVISGRGYTRAVRLARTIADLDGVLEVKAEHVAEALSLRLDHGWWSQG